MRVMQNACTVVFCRWFPTVSLCKVDVVRMRGASDREEAADQACAWGNMEVIAVLLRHKADVRDAPIPLPITPTSLPPAHCTTCTRQA
jgi:hypothetical protein